MKYYFRYITHREPINQFGKMGTPLYLEFFKTTSEEFVKAQNKNKQKRFQETRNPDIIKKLVNLDVDTVYMERVVQQ